MSKKETTAKIADRDLETGKETNANTAVKAGLKNNKASAALAAFGKDGEEVEQLTELFIREYPIDKEPLIGYYLGQQLMKHKDGTPVKDMNKKDWITHKFMTTEGELVFLNRAGMLDKRLDNDTELGQKVYYIESKGKQPMNDGSERMAYLFDISCIKSKTPMSVEQMAATDAALSK